MTSISQPFFAQFSSGIAVGTYPSSSTTFTTLTTAIKSFADGFIAENANYTPSGGGLAEQYSRSNGSPVSAVDLTWSYAAALTAFAARAGQSSPGWGATGLTVPSTCSSGGGGGDSGTVTVTFNVNAITVFGGMPLLVRHYGVPGADSFAENIYITGSVPELQNWSPDNAMILDPANYPIWSSTCNLSSSLLFEILKCMQSR